MLKYLKLRTYLPITQASAIGTMMIKAMYNIGAAYPTTIDLIWSLVILIEETSAFLS